MTIKIEGIKEAQKQLDEIIQNLDPDSMAAWMEKVANTADELCKEARISYTPRDESKAGNLGSIGASNPKGRDCIKKALETLIPTAPPVIKEMLQSYKKQIEKEMEEKSQ